MVGLFWTPLGVAAAIGAILYLAGPAAGLLVLSAAGLLLLAG